MPFLGGKHMYFEFNFGGDVFIYTILLLLKYIFNLTLEKRLYTYELFSKISFF